MDEKKESDPVENLRDRLKDYRYRTDILYLSLQSYRLDSRLQLVLNERGEFHVNDCAWARDGAKEGPDTCHCFSAKTSPDRFFDYRMKNPSRRRLVPLPAVPSPEPFDGDESLRDFFRYRVADRENVAKWYEMYKKWTDALEFRLKVRELGWEGEIDACYCSESGEWHLTDCERCVDREEGPDTCFCRTAMANPWKYLKEKYNYVDLKKVAAKMRKKKKPVNFEEGVRNRDCPKRV